MSDTKTPNYIIGIDWLSTLSTHCGNNIVKLDTGIFNSAIYVSWLSNSSINGINNIILLDILICISKMMQFCDTITCYYIDK